MAVFDLPSPLPTNLMKANSSQNQLLFSWAVDFFFVAKSTKSCRNSWKISRDMKKKKQQKKPVICCLWWLAFRPRRGYWELRAVCISASQSSSADFLSIAELGHFNLLAYSLYSRFSASYHCKKKARWLKHPVWFIKLNCSPSLLGRSPCRYQRVGTGTYCWLAAGSAGLLSNFPPGNFLGCCIKQDLQIHQLGLDSGQAAMQRLNQL